MKVTSIPAPETIFRTNEIIAFDFNVVAIMVAVTSRLKPFDCILEIEGKSNYFKDSLPIFLGQFYNKLRNTLFN